MVVNFTTPRSTFLKLHRCEGMLPHAPITISQIVTEKSSGFAKDCFRM